jgi:acetylornithine deacetylase/succinyl-diaminopimelate desuccinylase-like protein
MDPFEHWLTTSSDVEEAAELTRSLVAIRSLPGEEAEVQDAVANWLDRAGLNPIAKDVVPNRPNVTVTIANGPGPTMMFNGHVDTAIIDPTWDPNRLWGKREGDKLYGLGASDMKAGVAAALMATRALDQRRDLWSGTLVLTSVIDEEAFSLGALAVVDSGLRPDYSVVTESTLPAALIGSFGKVLVRVDVTGHAAHASWPDQGINAAVEAARFAARLSEAPLGTHPKIKPSQSVLSFHSGPTTYQSITVPDQARLLINWHTAPGESADDVVSRLKALANSLASPASFVFSVDDPYYPAWETPVDAPLLIAFSRAYESEFGNPPPFAYTGYGDTNLFSDAGIPTMMFGARGANFHQADEWVDVNSIGSVIRVLLRLTCKLLPATRS